MKPNTEVIQSTVESLTTTQPASVVAEYINKAITMNREYNAPRVLISLIIGAEEISVCFSFAEAQQDDILLIGLQQKDGVFDTTKKIRLPLRKNSKEIQDLLCFLYQNIVQQMQV